MSILGSVVNGQLTVHLTQRLIQIGIPKAYRDEVITAVTTGTISARLKGLGKTSAAVQAIINKVVGAAYSAFHRGLDLALTASAALLLLSAVVAYVTGTSGGDELL